MLVISVTFKLVAQVISLCIILKQNMKVSTILVISVTKNVQSSAN